MINEKQPHFVTFKNKNDTFFESSDEFRFPWRVMLLVLCTCLCRVLWWCLLRGCRVVTLCCRLLLLGRPSLAPSPSSRAPSAHLRSPSAEPVSPGTSKGCYHTHTQTHRVVKQQRQRGALILRCSAVRCYVPLQLLVVPLVGLTAGQNHSPGETAGFDPRHDQLTKLFGFCLRLKQMLEQ